MPTIKTQRRKKRKGVVLPQACTAPPPRSPAAPRAIGLVNAPPARLLPGREPRCYNHGHKDETMKKISAEKLKTRCLPIMNEVQATRHRFSGLSASPRFRFPDVLNKDRMRESGAPGRKQSFSTLSTV